MAKSKNTPRKGFTLKPTDRPPEIREVDGITFDLARWTKKDHNLIDELHRKGENILAVAYQVEKRVVKWPFDQPITQLGYCSLGEPDARRVAAAMLQAVEQEKEK